MPLTKRVFRQAVSSRTNALFGHNMCWQFSPDRPKFKPVL